MPVGVTRDSIARPGKTLSDRMRLTLTEMPTMTRPVSGAAAPSSATKKSAQVPICAAPCPCYTPSLTLPPFAANHGFSMLQEMRKYAKGWVSSVFLGALALSFGVWGIADIFKGTTDTSVATVGSSQISAETYQQEYN